MPDLGKKHECAECSTKFYDLGKADSACPRCGSTQRAAPEREKPAPAPRTRAAVVVAPVVEEPEEELVDDIVEEDEEIIEVLPGEVEEEEEEEDEA